MHLDSTLRKFDQWRAQNQLIEVKLKMSKIAIEKWKLFKLFEKKIPIWKFCRLVYEKISKIVKKMKIDRNDTIKIFCDPYLHDRGHKSKVSDLESKENIKMENEEWNCWHADIKCWHRMTSKTSHSILLDVFTAWHQTTTDNENSPITGTHCIFNQISVFL